MFTQEHLILRLLNHFPEEYLKNKEYKWYDPTAGYGQFPAVITKVLMSTLKDQIPNEDERFKHIVENQIYMSEYQPASANIIRECFTAIDESIKLNLYVGSSLELDIKKQWGVDRLDIGAFNPPYNDEEGAKQYTGTGSGMGTYFYQKFIKVMKQQIDKAIGIIIPPSGHKHLMDDEWQLTRYIFNRNDDWPKSITTRSYIVERESDRELQVYPEVWSKLINKEYLGYTSTDHRIKKMLYMKTLAHNADDSVFLNKVRTAKGNAYVEPIPIESTPQNLKNLKVFLEYTKDFYPKYITRPITLFNILDLQWMQSFDRDITFDDIEKYYKLTQEDKNIIKENKKYDHLIKDFR